MKSSYDPFDTDDSLSGAAGLRVIIKARKLAESFGESFVIFIGSSLLSGNAVIALQKRDDAQTRARDYVSSGIPRELVQIRRIKL